MHKTFIYDFDGTISDSFETIVKIIRENQYYFKVDIDNPKIFNKLRDIPADEILQYLGIPKDKIAECLIFMNSQMGLYINNLKLIKGMESTIDKLAHKGVFQAIISSNLTENIATFLRNNKVRGYFNTILTDNTLFDKEHCIDEIINRYKKTKEEIWFIGDEPRDIIAGKKAGVGTIGVTWGLSSSLLEKSAPATIVDYPSELPGFAV